MKERKYFAATTTDCDGVGHRRLTVHHIDAKRNVHGKGLQCKLHISWRMTWLNTQVDTLSVRQRMKAKTNKRRTANSTKASVPRLYGDRRVSRGNDFSTRSESMPHGKKVFSPATTSPGGESRTLPLHAPQIARLASVFVRLCLPDTPELSKKLGWCGPNKVPETPAGGSHTLSPARQEHLSLSVDSQCKNTNVPQPYRTFGPWKGYNIVHGGCPPLM